MHVVVMAGDILDQCVDVLICTANPWLNMSGGLNGEILLRGGQDIQRTLHTHLAERGVKYVEPGSAVVTGPGPLTTVRHIVHVVAIDPWYQSSVELMCTAAGNALGEAARLGARTAALPGLAMGYGRQSADAFGKAVQLAVQREYPPIEEVRVVLRKEAQAAAVRAVLGSGVS